MKEMRNTYKILVGKSEGKRALGRPKRRWEDNFRMDFRNRVGRFRLDSYGFCEHGNEISGSIKGGEFLD
jgi:hypothetical protein